GGVRYLRTLLDTFHGDLDLTLAAYNAGPGAVQKYNGVPPYPETREYVRIVRARYEEALKR
ncbi:MAG: lytic transglycosylase domain-containing protein, partial [Acidobacteria bacterium]|nr:lytic transglycosylase domain-containing protein [Acidobacteriota bacterium]